MPLQKIGINFTNIQNVSSIDFDIKNNTADFFNDIPIKANEISKGWWGISSLSILFVWLLWKFNRQSIDGGDFGYDTARSIGITSCICSIIGLYALNMGYIPNFFHVVIFIITAFITLGVVWKNQA